MPELRRPARPRSWSTGAIVGVVILGTVGFAATIGPAILPYGQDSQDLRARLLPPAWMNNGRWAHPLGTDSVGRDLGARLVYGARMSLLIGAGAMTLSFAVGVSAGLLAGYHGGWPGAIAMRVADVQAAFPSLLLAIAVAAFLRPSIPILLLVLALRGWVVYARLTRGAVLSLMAREFVVSAVAVGAGRVRILLRHILPGMMSTLIVVSGLQFGQFILAESTLSFLGVGIQPPTASWGGMLSDGRSYLGTSWWLATFPGLAIVSVVLGANLIGDALPRWLGLRRSV